ncbi:MAG: CapA family protein [Bacteroidales bacterium]|nr:CapA family protein [Bacteroidales bacterium]
MQSNNNIRLFFAGDFCSKPSTSFITPSDELKSVLSSCDCRIVNFEVPLKPDIELPPRKEERFFQNDDAPKFLRNLGFDLFSIANNHTFDWGEEGFKKTKAALGEASFGAGTYEEAYQVKEIEINGIKIGFLALSFAVYTWPLLDTKKREGLGCAYLNDLQVNHIIIDAKKRLDYLFVLPHDGIEYIDAPMPETIARYRDFIDYGADGVFGAHPHCPQGWEEYKGKPMFYSLGNFFFNSKKDTLYRATNRPHWYEGRCVVLSIENQKLSWEVINTRNVDNIALEIDHSEESIRHNEYVCDLLTNEQAYNEYISPIIRKQVDSYLSKMNAMFQPKSVKQALNALRNCLIGKNKNAGAVSNNKDLLYLFRNDLRRAQMLRFLLGKIK